MERGSALGLREGGLGIALKARMRVVGRDGGGFSVEEGEGLGSEVAVGSSVGKFAGSPVLRSVLFSERVLTRATSPLPGLYVTTNPTFRFSSLCAGARVDVM